MRRKAVLTLGLALCAVAFAAPQKYEMKSYVRVGSEVKPAFAWCDAPDRVLAVTQPASPSAGAQRQPTTLLSWPKQNPGQPLKAEYLLGPSEGAAGTIYTTLTPAGQKPSSDDTRNYISISNIENVQDPAYRMTHVKEFKLEGKSYRCRYQPQAAFMGVTNKRTVIIWDNGKTATYATRNFDGTPGVYVTGGKKINSVEGGSIYDFTTKDGYTYHVSVDDYGPATGAYLSVRKGTSGRGGESFLAYSVSTPDK